MDSLQEKSFGLGPGWPPAENTEKPALPTDPLEALVSLQDFDGLWFSSDDVLGVIGVSREKIEEAVRAKGANWGEGLLQGGANALVTAGVLAFLKKKLAGQEEEWEMIGDKGWDWLVTTVPVLDGKRDDLESSLGFLFG